MKKLLPLLLLVSICYAAWFYWQRYTDLPLSAPLLTVAAEDVAVITIPTDNSAAPLTLTRTDQGWVVSRPPQQLLEQSLKAEALLDRLIGLQTDSVAYGRPKGEGVSILIKSVDGHEDNISIYQGADGTPFAATPATGDLYYLNPDSFGDLLPRLSFDYYRSPRLLNLQPHQVDSIVISVQDSLHQKTAAEKTTLLANHILAPASAPYADFFDEIAHRDRYLADVDFYFSGRAHRVQVFRDSLWPQPYVLVGEDYPRRYLSFKTISADSLQ